MSLLSLNAGAQQKNNTLLDLVHLRAREPISTDDYNHLTSNSCHFDKYLLALYLNFFL